MLAGGLEGVRELLAAERELATGEVGTREEDLVGEALQQRGPSVVLQLEPFNAGLYAVCAGDGIVVELPIVSGGYLRRAR